MNVHIDLMLAFRQFVLGAKVRVEFEANPVYAIILRLLLEATTLAITLNMNTILTALGA